MYDVFTADGTYIGAMDEAASASYIAHEVGSYRQYLGECFPGSCELTIDAESAELKRQAAIERHAMGAE